MSTDPINTMPIQQLIQIVKVAEQGRAKEVRLDIAQAKTLAFTLGEVMARLHGDLEEVLDKKIEKLNQDQTIEINMDSGAW
jgi:CRISPR/Cas system CSM-associated protein Csm2 small subunit